MELIIEYLLNDELKKINIDILKTAKFDNGDILLTCNVENNRYIINLNTYKKIILQRINLEKTYSYKEISDVFVNGYQSWTDTKEYDKNDQLKNLNKIPKGIVNRFGFDKYGDSYFYKYRKNVMHGYDISYLRGNCELFIASYNYSTAYLIIEHYIKNNMLVLVSDISNLTLLENSFLCLYDFLMCDNIADGLNRYFDKKIPDKKILGYTSWYNYYENINEQIIMDSLDGLDERFNLFQIDDGYETHVGDWKDIDKNKFPNGLDEIITKIKGKKMLAGIWLAPFVACKSSTLFSEHPEYFAVDENHNYIQAGSNWGGFYCLNFYNEEARNYVKSCLNFYLDKGFDFFKLDFLYAVSIPNFPNKTRAQVADEAYQFIRDILKDKLILGCGATLSNTFNRFDYMRIGPDVSLIFDDVWYMRLFHRERISTKTTIQNTIYRAIFNNHVFLNDPDVFLLRENNIKLSEKRRYALSMINALFGSIMMTSDNMNYSSKLQDIFKQIYYVFMNHKDVTFKKNKNLIHIRYQIDDAWKEFDYDINKGEIING